MFPRRIPLSTVGDDDNVLEYVFIIISSEFLLANTGKAPYRYTTPSHSQTRAQAHDDATRPHHVPLSASGDNNNMTSLVNIGFCCPSPWLTLAMPLTGMPPPLTRKHDWPVQDKVPACP